MKRLLIVLALLAISLTGCTAVIAGHDASYTIVQTNERTRTEFTHHTCGSCEYKARGGNTDNNNFQDK